MKSSKRAIFLDRDGTINELNGYITDVEQIKILDGVHEAIEIFKKLQFIVIVITNQPVINMGLISEQDLDIIHRKIQFQVMTKEGSIDRFLFCPHEDILKVTNLAVAVNCNCRKPKTGLIDQALKLFPINLEESWLIGDSWRDVELANNVGINYFQIVEKQRDKNLAPNQVYSLEQAATLIEAKLKLKQDKKL